MTTSAAPGTERLKAEIDDLPNIASKQYISKEDALKELSDTLGSQSFLEGFEQYADENPLPASFRLKVNSLENLPETVKTLESLSGWKAWNPAMRWPRPWWVSSPPSMWRGLPSSLF